MSDNRCICCGEIIPEGMLACPNCLVVSKRQATEPIFTTASSANIRPDVFMPTTMQIPFLICGEGVTVPRGQYSVRICKKMQRFGYESEGARWQLLIVQDADTAEG